MISSENYTTDFVISKDGTKIGYRQIGKGEGIILVHGGMMASQNFMKLAGFLADEFSIFIPDRRGRGLSGPHGDNYSLMAESEDIQAIIKKTRTKNIFGLSSGAVVVLQTALIDPYLKRVAVYEPPIPVNDPSQFAWVEKFKLAILNEKFGEAFVRIIKGTGDSSIIKKLPGFITIPFMNFAIRADAKEIKKENEVSLKTLVSTMFYDPQAVQESIGIIEKCKDINAEILLLGGQNSQEYLRMALNELSVALPDARKIIFKGQGHLAPVKVPDIVAKELKAFFSSK